MTSSAGISSNIVQARRWLKIGWWCAKIVEAALVGMVVRYFRKWSGLSPRIWHGMYPLHSTRYMVQADLFSGSPSRSVVYHSKQIGYALVKDEDFDIVLQKPGIAWDDVHWLALFDLLRKGDIWVAFFECLFFRPEQTEANSWAFRLIKFVGIHIVVVAHGGDIGHITSWVTRFNVMQRVQLDYPDWDLIAHRSVVDARVSVFCRYADMVLPGDSVLARFLPRCDLLFKYFPINCVELRPVVQEPRLVPSIVHAPNHRFTKGSDFLVSSVSRLADKGIDCKLVLVERVAHDAALSIYQQADIIADQFCNGSFGQFALEGLAMGKPVLTYLDQEHLGNPVFNLPFVNTNPENLDMVLTVLIRVRALRERIGNAGRTAVETYQSVSALADVWARIYSHIWRGDPLGLDETQHFSPSRSPRSFTEDPSKPEFWPVPVYDLEDQIRAALVGAGFSVSK